MKFVENSIENRRKIDEISILAGLGARGWLRDAPGRVWNGLGTPSWAVLAAKLAVLAALAAVRGAKLAISSAKLALLGCFRALVDRVASANPSPSSVRSEFSPDVGTLATSPKLEIRAPTQCFVRVRRSCRSVHIRSDEWRRNRRSGFENRAPERPESVSGAPGRAKSSGKTQPERHRTAGRIFFCQSSAVSRNAGAETQPNEERARQQPRGQV